jgi:hypothetical protein
MPGWPPMNPQKVVEPGGPEFIAQGLDGQLTVTPTTVGVRRRGTLAAKMRKGDKVVPLANLTAIYLHPASPQSGGFVQICYQGGDQKLVTGWAAGSHKDVVMFTQAQEPAFLQARYLIDQIKNGRR